LKHMMHILRTSQTPSCEGFNSVCRGTEDERKHGIAEGIARCCEGSVHGGVEVDAYVRESKWRVDFEEIWIYGCPEGPARYHSSSLTCLRCYAPVDGRFPAAQVSTFILLGL
jgi:hypothetical protein